LSRIDSITAFELLAVAFMSGRRPAGVRGRARLGREIGAYLALLASVAAVVPVARPVVRPWPGRR
jgi:hypothetical protein